MERPYVQRRECPCLERLTKVSYGHGDKVCKLTPNNNHINDVDDARVFESFEDLDFSEGGDRHPFLLVVHKNPL